MAGVAATLVVVVIVGVLLADVLNRNPKGAAPVANSVPTASPDPVSNLPFNCLGSASLSAGPAPALAYVDEVRVATYSGYDRVTIRFADGRPAKTDLNIRDGATFDGGTGGETVTLKGSYGALLILHSADGHTDYGGPTDLQPGYSLLLEMRKVQDGDGTVQWAIGLSGLPCYRMSFLDNPVRLVVDFSAG
jgi:hypothetical protein